MFGTKWLLGGVEALLRVGEVLYPRTTDRGFPAPLHPPIELSLEVRAVPDQVHKGPLVVNNVAKDLPQGLCRFPLAFDYTGARMGGVPQDTLHVAEDPVQPMMLISFPMQ